MDNLALWVVGGAVALAVLYWLFKRRAGAGSGSAASDRLDTVIDWPPTATRVLTSGERLAYKTLVRALPGHMILAQVPLARFLKVPTRHSYSEWLRRLGNQCADLVVCDMASEVVAVVSVRPSAVDSGERSRKRHQRMARVLKAARIPLHVWIDNALPTAERARELLLPKSADAALGAEARAPAGPVEPSPSRPAPLELDLPAEAADEANPAVDPPPSTWFDEFNSGPVPLQPPKQP